EIGSPADVQMARVDIGDFVGFGEHHVEDAAVARREGVVPEKVVDAPQAAALRDPGLPRLLLNQPDRVAREAEQRLDAFLVPGSRGGLRGLWVWGHQRSTRAVPGSPQILYRNPGEA